MLAELDMHDVWRLAHSGSEHPPPAATYGWAHKGRRANPRRSDRIHVNAALTEWVSGAYTVLTGADHKVVVLQLSPPATVQGKPRPRFPEGMLSDEHPMLGWRSKWCSFRLTFRRTGGRKHCPLCLRRGVNGLE